MTRWWKGEIECGICGAVCEVKVELFDNQEIDEPIIPLECMQCGSRTCHVCIDTDEESDEVWDIEDGDGELVG